MSTACQSTEITSAVAGSWTQIDGTPLTARKYAEVINNDTTQEVGVIFTSGAAPTGAWNTGEVLLRGDKTGIVPAEGAVKCYVKTSTGAQVTGSALVLREWN